jgi:hypothetical protein
MPAEKLEAKIAKYEHDGKAVHQSILINDSDFDIVAKYGSEYQGFVQYYAFAKNRFWLYHLGFVMKMSMLKTLAAKHKSTVRRMSRKYRSKTHDGKREIACIAVVVERPGKMPLVARFGGLSLRTNPYLTIEDRRTGLDRVTGRSELIARLLADECELCGSREKVQVHHVRKLADLDVPGQKAPGWKRLMAARKRKTLVVCETCHIAIHAGRPAGKRERQGAPDQ